jgi:hypothetical protein
METTMSENVSIAKVELIRVVTAGKKGQVQYDGTVTLRAKSASLEFDYEYNFANMDSVPDAISRAAELLKRELQMLAAVAQNVMHPPPPLDEEDA